MYYKIEDEIMDSWKLGDGIPLVSIVCITYGQEAYIEQAIDSILMQCSDFRFEIIIGEDCSPDNSREILIEYQKAYPNIIKLVLQKENKGVSDNAEECIRMSSGKYIAILEGDDFWTDAFKLQKQVDFLEANSDYGLVHGDVNHFYDDTEVMIPAYNKKNNIKIYSGDIYTKLLEPSHMIKTMTVCFRKDLLEKYYFENKFIMDSKWKLVDISIWLMFAKYSKIHYFDEVFATYRLVSESMSRTQDFNKMYKFHGMIAQIRFFYLRSFPVEYEVKKKVFIWYYLDILKYAYLLKNRKLLHRAQYGLNFFNQKLTLKERVKGLIVKFSSNK